MLRGIPAGSDLDVSARANAYGLSHPHPVVLLPLLVTDLAIDAARDAVRRSDAVLYAIGIGTRRGVPVDTTVLDSLAKESGGYTELLRRPFNVRTRADYVAASAP